MLLNIGMVKVAQSTVVIDLQDAQNIFYSDAELQIRLVAERLRAFGEDEQPVSFVRII